MYCVLGSYCLVVTEANHDNEFFEHEATAFSIIRAYFSENMKIRVQGTPNQADTLYYTDTKPGPNTNVFFLFITNPYSADTSIKRTRTLKWIVLG